MVCLIRRFLILLILMTLTKKLFNKQPLVFEYNTTTQANSPAKIKKASTNQEVLEKIEKLNAHIDELSFLLSLSNAAKNLDRLLNRVNEIKKQATAFDISKLINLNQLEEIEKNILIIQRSIT